MAARSYRARTLHFASAEMFEDCGIRLRAAESVADALVDVRPRAVNRSRDGACPEIEKRILMPMSRQRRFGQPAVEDALLRLPSADLRHCRGMARLSLSKWPV